MEVLFLLIPLSVLLALLVGVIFWYALRSGQFDDLDVPGLAVIADRDHLEPPMEDGPLAQAPPAESTKGISRQNPT